MGDGVVRPARLQDAERIGQVHVASWRETYGHLLSADFLAALDPAARAQMWRAVVSHHPEAVHVADVDGDVVGFVSVHRADGPRDLKVRALYLLAAHHGGGLGQALLEAGIGSRPAFLWVAEDNPRAQAFYARNGFRPDGGRTVVPELEDLVGVRLVR
jgi:GNAT superfamily N-acetyltransferase